jgi:hypothetical protein
MRLDEPVVGRAADEQGRAMGNNQALQVGAEALSGAPGDVSPNSRWIFRACDNDGRVALFAAPLGCHRAPGTGAARPVRELPLAFSDRMTSPCPG